jgi:hypothetical protein
MIKTVTATIQLSPDELKEIIKQHFKLREATIYFAIGSLGSYDDYGGAQGLTRIDVTCEVPTGKVFGDEPVYRERGGPDDR